MYRFTLTTRLAVIAVACLLSLLALLFLLGVEVGRHRAAQSSAESPGTAVKPAGEMPYPGRPPEVPKISAIPAIPATPVALPVVPR